jgi:signal transduction histidine kinase
MTPEPTPRWSLRRRILVGVVGYAVLLAFAIGAHGWLVNERAEALVWESLLQAELDHFVERRRADPSYRWPETPMLDMFTASAGLPPPLDALAPGVYDEVDVAGRERVLLVRDTDGERLVLALDIAQLEKREQRLSVLLVTATLALVALLTAAVVWGVGRLTRPLRELATRIAALEPERGRERVELPAGASVELATIADATNAFLDRNARYVERERAFVDTASHELRTPVAIILGAAQNALADAALPPAGRAQLVRIRETARDVESLIALLLVLAKDPARLADISEHVALETALPSIVDDHRYLTRDKALTVTVTSLEPCAIVAPPHIVRAAIGNLVRNAIENSDRGDIAIALDAHGVVSIVDPGHGMTPVEIAAIHSKLARGADRDGGGIGLALIGRLCEHFGWRLDITSSVGQGSRVTLDFSASAATTRT